MADFALFPSSTAARSPVADTLQGKVRGVTKDGVTTYKGVPFAKPPVGALRFAPPQPPESRTSVLDCQQFQCSAVQVGDLDPGLVVDEDCLYLNIWAPEGTPCSALESLPTPALTAAPLAPGGGLPVFVFIHGGGFSKGSPAKWMYDGSRFACGGVVQVNIAYRLGALGFLAHEEVMAEHGTCGNNGLLDQIAALQWVQSNIAFFGGDPGQVTICGESAGAFSISNLLLSPRAKGLFHRAILESGSLLGQPIVAPMASGSRTQALVMGKAFAASFGAHTLAELREVDAKALARAGTFGDDMTNPNPYSFWPVFDGDILPKNPYDALMHDAGSEVPLLVGFNSDEGSMFVPPGTDDESYIQMVWRIFGESALKVLRRYPPGGPGGPAMQARGLVQMGLRFGGEVFADEFSRRGQPVYYYNFDYRPGVLDRIGLGSVHALELLYVFDSLPKAPLRKPEAIAFQKDIHARWLNFVRFGNPNQGEALAVQWPRYTQENRQMLVLNEAAHAAPTASADDVAFLVHCLWEK